MFPMFERCVCLPIDMPYDWPFPFLFFPCFPPAGAPAGGAGGGGGAGIVNPCAVVRLQGTPAGWFIGLREISNNPPGAYCKNIQPNVRVGQFWSAIPPLDRRGTRRH